MYDYRNNIKIILNKTDADDKSLANSLNAIKAILAMAEGGTAGKAALKRKLLSLRRWLTHNQSHKETQI